MTVVLCLLNVVVFLLALVGGASFTSPTAAQLLPWGAEFGPLVLSGGWWRLFTAMFLHFGILHLALNMWCLLQLGPLAEFLFGRVAFLILYLLSGLGGGVLSLLVHPTVVSAGASGAIFGVAGGVAAYLWLHQLGFHSAKLAGTLPSVGLFIVYNLVNGFGEAGIDNAGHLGGLIAGAAIGALLPPPSARPTRVTRLRLPVAAFVVAALVAYGASRARREHADLLVLVQARQELDAGRYDRAIADLNRVLAQDSELLDARALRAEAYARTARWADAATDLSLVIHGAPDDASLWFQRGNARLHLSQVDSAIADYARAIALAPGDAPAYFNRGLAYALQGKAASARADLEKTLALSADSALQRKARDLLSQLGPDRR